jgi:hypothetical protein
MSRHLRRWAAGLWLALLPSLALAQGTPVYQSGQMIAPHNAAKITRNGQLQDAGGLTGDASGRGVNPFSVYDALGLGACSNSANSSGPYNAFCLGHDASGNGLISLDSYGGLGNKTAYLRKNGALYEFPFTVGGILGPSPTTSQNLPLWNNGVGTLLSDSGLPYSMLRKPADNLPTPGNFYVGGTGASDGNDCLAATVTGGHGPCATMQFVVNTAMRGYSAAARNHKINVATGTLTSGFVCAGPIAGGGSGNVTYDGSMIDIVGAGAGLSVINDTSGAISAIIVQAGCTVQLSHLTVSTTTAGGSALWAANFGLIEVGTDTVYGPASGATWHVEFMGLIEAYQNFTVIGSAAAAFGVAANGMIELDPVGLTVTVAGTPAYSVGFISAVDQGIVYTGNATFAGGATGPRAKLASGGLIETLNASPTYLPGTTPMVNQGGVYSPEPIATVLAGATGLGAVSTFHGTVQLNAGSNSSDGVILLNSGATGAAGQGQAFIGIPATMLGSGGALAPAICGPSALSSAWNAPIIYCHQDALNPNTLIVTWANTTPGSATNTVLTANSQYAINYSIKGRN